MKFKKTTAVLLIALTLFAFSSKAMAADDTMQTTVRDSLYGGLLGALLGTAVLFLTDKPGDHLDYIPTGAAVGILAGATYGLATSTVVRAAGEYENGRFTLNAPTLKREKVYDEKTKNTEIIETVDIIRLKF